ncbi:RING-H2 finger protein ATL56-like [Syzygium oleosum]|uniref:RING-H2 finger protein ATL56-like n=1 Tax=Syzygium oleosum TaxID=219896 RepID=UPI0024BACC29|nr:RING-H2 finger protein ATL56-like [Syzygium oleosum]
MPPPRHDGPHHGGEPAAHGHRHGGASPPGPPPPPKQNPKLLSLLLKAIIMTLITTLFFLFLGLAAIILLHLCLAGGLLHRRRQIDLPPAPGGALPPRELKRLPKFRYPKRGAQGQQYQGCTDCAVCLDEFSQGQWCRKLVGCGHVFHRSCVDTWLVKVAACPVCRSQVRAQVGSTRSGIDGRDCKQLWAFGRETPI